MPGGNGDLSPKNVAYVIERGGPYTPTPIVYHDLLYAVQNNGAILVHDARKGEKKFEAKLNGEFSASPVASDGRVFFASEDGTISILKASPQFELIAEIDMGSPIFATPAISDHMLFVRTQDQLYAIAK
jgi:outer membrane protein assembly factor BamB